MEEKTKNILIVEDEMIISLMLERMVQRMGHNVVGKVSSGEEAVTIATAKKPDLILMDIRLDGPMDGIEATSRIREELNVPVIFVTGNSDKACIDRVKKVGYEDFLVKPITYRQLGRSVVKAS